MSEIGILAAFGAGLLSFLSPCVLPLIPGYLSFISGYGLAEIRGGEGRGRVFARTGAFVLGFGLVFMLLGLVFSGGGLALGAGSMASLGHGGGGLSLSRILSLVAGLLVIFLGFNLIFDLVKVLNMEARFHPDSSPRGLGGAFVLGLAFAAGWSPCVGPILASILILAAREGSLGRSSLLLGAYTLGLALPFLAAGLFFDRLRPLMDFFKRHARAVRIVSGSLLIALGAAMAFGRLGALSSAAAQLGFALKRGAIASPGASRLCFGGGWLALGLLLGLPPLLKRRGLRGPRFVFAMILVGIGLGELLGLYSTATILSEWLLFQGA